MEMRPFGRTGVEVSAIALGAWAYGHAAWSDVDDEESIAAIHAALDAGINLIDTAVAYGKGYSEEIVGKAVKDRRDEVLLASKCGADPRQIPQAIDAALKRMQTDVIDLYQIHYPSPRIPIADSVGAMTEIQQAGKIRWIGVSNFSLGQLQEAVATARIESCQPPFNVFWRQIDNDVLPFCVENHLAVLAYSPLAQGLLAGRFRKREDIPDDIRAQNKLMQEGVFEKCLEVVELLEQIGQRYGKSLVQVAINWVASFPGITAPIVGGRKPSQVQENVGGVGWKLSDEDMELISRRGLEVSQLLDYSSNMWGYAPK